MKYVAYLDSYMLNYLIQRALCRSAISQELKKLFKEEQPLQIKLNGRDGARWARIYKDKNKGGYWVELHIRK